MKKINRDKIKKKAIRKSPKYKEYYDDAFDLTDDIELMFLRDDAKVNHIISLAKIMYEKENKKTDRFSEWKKNHEEKYTNIKPDNLHQWCLSDSTEFTPHSEYIWSDDTWNIYQRLQAGTGQIITVVMEQGLGKTAFCYEMVKCLAEDATYVKLNGRYPITQQLEYSILYNGTEFLRHFQYRGEHPIILPIRTIIIEFPDYSKNSHTQVTRDFNRIEEMIKYNKGFNLSRKLNYNILLVWQQELPLDFHFHIGKWYAKYIRHFTPETLVKHVMRLYPEQVIFTDDALQTCAFLAQGNLRSFKRYLSKCIERRPYGSNQITSDNVRQWITIEDIAIEWRRKLSTVFPKSEYKLELAVDILTSIRIKPIYQSEVCSVYFDNDKVQTSKFLGSLEEKRFIKRKRDGKEKIVYPCVTEGVEGWYADSF